MEDKLRTNCAEQPHSRDRIVSRFRIVMVSLCTLTALGLGCSHLPKQFTFNPTAIDPGMTKVQLVQHLNQNVVGTEQRSGLVSWQTTRAKVKVTGIPLSLPATIAVEAPRNLRIVVSNPMSGGQELDIGSNQERFWIWSKETAKTMTSRHEDLELALNRMNMPVPIHPDWLIEIFGVIPIDANEYELRRPSSENGSRLELVAVRQSPSGHAIERAILINPARGVIDEHQIRQPGGKIIARALLADYMENPTGTLMPQSVRILWPEAKVELNVNLGRPEVNPPALASNTSLWELPHIRGADTIDIGEMARHAPTAKGVSPVHHQSATQLPPRPGSVQLPPSVQLEAPVPFGTGASPPTQPRGFPSATAPGVNPVSARRSVSNPLQQQTPPARNVLTEQYDAPVWAQKVPFPETGEVTLPSTTTTSTKFEAERPSTYSAEAWRSSSAPHLRAQE